MPIAVSISPVPTPGSQRCFCSSVVEVDEVRRARCRRGCRRTSGSAALTLASSSVEHRVEAVVAGLGAAVLLGDLEAEEALLAGLQPELARAAPCLAACSSRWGLTVAVQELRDRAAERLVVLVVDRRASWHRPYCRVTTPRQAVTRSGSLTLTDEQGVRCSTSWTTNRKGRSTTTSWKSGADVSPWRRPSRPRPPSPSRPPRRTLVQDRRDESCSSRVIP